jgi:hypothetical protein
VSKKIQQGDQLFSSPILREMLLYFKPKPRQHGLVLPLFEMERESEEEEQQLDLGLELYQMENYVT